MNAYQWNDESYYEWKIIISFDFIDNFFFIIFIITAFFVSFFNYFVSYNIIYIYISLKFKISTDYITKCFFR